MDLRLASRRSGSTGGGTTAFGSGFGLRSHCKGLVVKRFDGDFHRTPGRRSSLGDSMDK